MNLLFEPFSIRNLTLRNRFVRSATYDGMAERNGHVSTKQIRMVEELARGGVGLIIWGITYVHPSGQISPVQNSLADNECIPGFRTLAETAHEHGAKIAVQLFHAGRETAKVFKPHRKQALAPSYVPGDPFFQYPHREITETEIQQVIRGFGEAANRAKKVTVPVMMVGGLRTPTLMEEVIQNGEADLISLSRPLIKEPAIIKDWQNGDLHRATCLSCNKCFEALRNREALHCVYHEETGK